MHHTRKDIPTYNVALKDCSVETKDIEVFEIHRLEEMLKVTENISFPHRHSFFNLLFIHEGHGKHVIDFKEYKVKPYRIFFMAEGQIHSWELSANTTGFTLFFTREFFELHTGNNALFDFNFFYDSYRPSYIDVSKTQFENLLKLLTCLENEKSDVSVEGEGIVWSYVNILLLKIKQLQAVSSNKEGNEYSIVREFQSLINQHFNEKKRITDFAEMLHINPNYLNTLCKQATGRNAKGILNERVALEAKRLLYNSNLTISEIAYRLNFNDNSYFSRFFKKSAGVTPEVFRRDKKRSSST